MEKFFLKLFIAFTCVYLPWVCFVQYGKFYYTPVDFISWDFKHQLISQSDFNPKDIIIGDSLAMTAIDPSVISPDLYNLAQSGSTPVDAFYFLQKYLDTGKTPRKVFLSFGITHWQSSDVFREQTIAYGFMSSAEFSEFAELTEDMPPFYKPEEVINVFENWIPFRYFFDSFVKRFRKEIMYFDFLMMRIGLSPMMINHMKNNLFEMFNRENVQAKKWLREKLILHAGQHLFKKQDNINDINSKVNYKSWSIHPVNKLYFERIIQLLSQKNIDMELVFVPNNPTTWSQFDKKFFQEMYNFFNLYSLASGKLKYNELRSFSIDKLGDLDHVNELGALEFSHYFRTKYYGK